MRSTASTLMLLWLAAACASGGGSSGGSGDLITREEIDQTPAENVHELVQRLRPRWLTARGTTSIQYGPALPVVYVDGLRLGGLEALQGLQANDVLEMRYMGAPEATTLYGTNHTGGLIQVTTRRR